MKSFKSFTLCLIGFGLIVGACSSAPANDTSLKSNPTHFKAYEVDFAKENRLPVKMDLTDPAKDTDVTKANDGVRISLKNIGSWRGFWGIASYSQFGGYVPLNGGEKLHVTYRYSTTAPQPTSAKGVLSIQYYGGETVEMSGVDKIIADGKVSTIEYTLPADASTKKIVALWLQLENSGPGEATFLMQKLWWDRPYRDNRLDADRILSTPPRHDTRVQPVNGQMGITIDGKPISGQGWASILNVTTGDEELKHILGDSGFKLARLVFQLGSAQYMRPQLYPPTWLGPHQFDFTYLDEQMARIIKASPQTKVILDVDMDGADWWVWLHPDSAGMDAEKGIPDYLSPQWRRDSRLAIRQMVAHVQNSAYADAVIGYQLFNGYTLDVNFEVDTKGRYAVQRYRDFLRKKYKTNAALRLAWSNPKADISTATPTATEQDYQKAFHSSGAFPLLFEPARHYELADKIAFNSHSFQQIVLNFCQDIKEATHNRAITGARTGDLMSQRTWIWPRPAAVHHPIGLDELIRSPHFDMFEVQESYLGRGIGDYGSGAPILPPQGLMAYNKLLMIQNDVRTHLSDPSEGFGRTPDLETTIQMQRRVFVNALTRGMPQYLWQMSWSYDDPSILADFRKMQQIDMKALASNRSTDAEIAFVMDHNNYKYFGYDPVKKEPSRGFALFDYLRFSWARAGVPYDIVDLDKLAETKPYKVYVFFHTVGLSDSQRNMIKKVVRQGGRTAIYFWADGAIDSQRINTTKMSDLVGMKVELSSQESNWKMNPTSWFQQQAGISPEYPMGTLSKPGDKTSPVPNYEASEPDAGNNTYAPSFWVSDLQARSLATYDAGSPLAGKTSIAMKKGANYTSIYSASVNLSPALLRYALKQSGAFIYTDSTDNCYINRSFIGLNAQTKPAHKIQVRVPQPTALYEVFRNQEIPPSDNFSIPVEPGQTYLYFRGSKNQWEKIAPNVAAH